MMGAAKEAVKRAGYDLSGFSAKTINEQLMELGAIGQHKNKQIRVGGTKPFVTHITAKALFGDDELDL
jgi:hypothetical protein